MLNFTGEFEFDALTEFDQFGGSRVLDGRGTGTGRRRLVTVALVGVLVTVAAIAQASPEVSEQLHQADIAATRSLAEAARAVPAAMGAATLVVNNPLFKGIVVMTAFWGLWFSTGREQGRQARLVAVLMLSVVAIIAGRALALLLPFRPRPRYSEELGAVFGSSDFSMAGWNAMPSDHAVLFLALAVGIGLVSRLFGILLVAHALLVVCLPRIILGLHHVGDVLVGAMVGASVAIITLPIFVRTLQTVGFAGFIERRPGWFYAGAIWITMQFALMFDPIRDLGKALSG